MNPIACYAVPEFEVLRNVMAADHPAAFVFPDPQLAVANGSMPEATRPRVLLNAVKGRRKHIARNREMVQRPERLWLYLP
jgi:hypothetical protein